MDVLRRNLLLSAALGPAAQAACARPYRIPLAPAGQMVVITEERLSGVVPGLLRQMRLPCPVLTPVAPRARIGREFFETHESDALWPAVRQPARDALADFVPGFWSRVALICERGAQAPVSAQALREREDWRGVVTRGISYGVDYDRLVAELGPRLLRVTDGGTALRMVLAGRVQFTLRGALLTPADLGGDAGARQRLQLQVLPDLPAHEVGAYVSRRSRPADELATLRAALNELTRSGQLARAMRKHFRPEELAAGVRLLP